MCRYFINLHRRPEPHFDPVAAAAFDRDDTYQFHRSLNAYLPTPMISLPGLAKKLGVGGIYVKDESHRLGLKAFKALGPAYAIFRFLKGEWAKISPEPFDLPSLYETDGNNPLAGKYTFATATDGNHGRAVAWTARKFKQHAVIFMPRWSVPARVKNIEKEGAEVIVVDGDYDKAVQTASSQAQKNGWHVIADTAYGDYKQVPADIMAGYLTIFHEVDDEPSAPSHFSAIFLQGGVGSFAAAAAWYYRRLRGDDKAKLIMVEPSSAACLLESAEAGRMTVGKGDSKTIMAGLNCGTPSTLAWPILRESFDLFLAIDDKYARRAMRQYYNPIDDDNRIISGESGAAGLGGLLAFMQRGDMQKAREALGLNSSSCVLLFNTEGDTDPENYRKIISAS